MTKFSEVEIDQAFDFVESGFYGCVKTSPWKYAHLHGDTYYEVSVETIRVAVSNVRNAYEWELRHMRADLGEKPVLKPCPFCGSEDLVLPTPTTRYVECSGCETLGPSEAKLWSNRGRSRQWDVTYADIIDRWNTRASIKPRHGGQDSQ